MAGKGESLCSELSPVPVGGRDRWSFRRLNADSATCHQCRWRNELVTSMARQGFVNYAKERRHFSLPGAAATAYDFPTRPRRS